MRDEPPYSIKERDLAPELVQLHMLVKFHTREVLGALKRLRLKNPIAFDATWHEMKVSDKRAIIYDGDRHLAAVDISGLPPMRELSLFFEFKYTVHIF